MLPVSKQVSAILLGSILHTEIFLLSLLNIFWMTPLHENKFKTLVQELWKMNLYLNNYVGFSLPPPVPLNGKPAFLYSDVAIQGIHPREPVLYYPEMCQTK